MTKAHAASADGSLWRRLAWTGVVLQGLAFVLVLWLERWNGAWTLGAFLAISIGFLVANMKVPSLMSFLVVLAALLNAGGWAFEWFKIFVWFDETIHFFSSFAVVAALVYRQLVVNSGAPLPGIAHFVVFGAAAGLALDVLWEIVEGLFLNLHLWDTISDLVLDTAGAAFGGLFAGWMTGRLATGPTERNG